MVQSKRVEERCSYFRYKGHAKIHAVPHFVALVADAADEAAAANEEAGYTAAMDEYAAACEAGRAVIVAEPSGDAA